MDIIISDFQNNDKRKFRKVIRRFVKSNSSILSIPPLCSTLPNGNNQWHFNDLDKANCLNDYFASISTANDEHTQLPPFSKLADISLSQIHCTRHEIENIIEVLSPKKANGDDGKVIKCSKVSPNLFLNPSLFKWIDHLMKDFFLVHGSLLDSRLLPVFRMRL